MKTETFLDDKNGTITTTKDLIRSQITRPLNNRELEEKIDSLCELLKKFIFSVAVVNGVECAVALISQIEELQKDLK